MLVSRIAGIAAALILGGVSLEAQDAARPAGPRTITGIVTDTSGNFVDSADVSIASIKRRVSSATDGSFKFADVKPGTYEVSARRFGFAPQVRSVVVGDNGVVVRFRLVPVPHALPAVVSSAVQGGLSGVIGDTAFNTVVGAEISVMGTDHRTTSDSLGKFYVDLHSGRFMVQVRAPGFVPRLISVTVPRDSGRRMVVWLVPGQGLGAREAVALSDLEDRLVHRTSSSKIYSREDLNNTGMTELSQLATSGAGRRVDDNCPAIVDGGPRTMAIWSIPAADIETLEIYPPGSLILGATSGLKSAPRTSINGMQAIRRPGAASGGADCPVKVYVWLRK